MSVLLVAAKRLPLLAACVLAGGSYPPKPADLTTPVQQRIAINGPNSMTIGWNTYGRLENACVQYGTAPDALSGQVCSTSSVTYPTSRTYSNAVTIAGLAPGTTYYYKIVSTNSTVEHFFSPRVPGDKTPFAMNAIIDLGVYGADGYTINMDMSKRDTIPQIDQSLDHTTISHLVETVDDYEFIVHPGDLAYADDWLLRGKNLLDGENATRPSSRSSTASFPPSRPASPIWRARATTRPTARRSPTHPGSAQPVSETSLTSCFTDFMNRFGMTMPAAFPSRLDSDTARIAANKAKMLANPPFWYSFEYGMVHVAMIDTETDFPNAPDSPGGSAGLNGGHFGRTATQQLDFLAADLASVDRSVTSWVIVGGHRPWYTTGGDTGGDKCGACRDAFEPLLYRYGVDLGIFGHVHNSQRFAPMYNGSVNPSGMDDPKAPMYIVAGGAGNIEGLSAAGRMLWAMFLHVEHLRVDFVCSATGEVLDSSVLYKSHAQRFVKRC